MRASVTTRTGSAHCNGNGSPASALRSSRQGGWPVQHHDSLTFLGCRTQQDEFVTSRRNIVRRVQPTDHVIALKNHVASEEGQLPSSYKRCADQLLPSSINQSEVLGGRRVKYRFHPAISGDLQSRSRARKGANEYFGVAGLR